MTRTFRAVLAHALVLAVASACAKPTSSPGHFTIDIRALAFTPQLLRATAGDTITWVNRDVVPHTVTALAGGSFDSGLIAPDGSFTLVLDSATMQQYHCLYHPVMRGALGRGTVDGDGNSSPR